MSAAVDVSSNARSPWNKYAWSDAVRAATADGSLSWKVRALSDELRATCGTAEPDQHVPVVWRTSSALADSIGYSQPTFRKQRDALADAGYLLEIRSGRGAQTLLVLKHPEASELEALQMARQSLRAYCDRTDTRTLGWVDDALSRAIADRRAAATASTQIPDASDDVGEMKEQRGGDETAFHLPLLYMERLPCVFDGCRSSEHSSPPSDDPSPPTPHQTSSSENSSSSIIDFEHVGDLRDCWQRAFAEYGRSLDEGIAVKLARTYGPHLEEADELFDGLFETPNGQPESLNSRLARLFGNGTSTGRVISFLLDDVETFHVPSNDFQESPTSNSTATTETVEDGSEEHFYRRLHDVTYELGGLDHFDEAKTLVEEEWQANGWHVPEV